MLLCIIAYHSMSALSYVKVPQWIPLEIHRLFLSMLSRCLGAFFLISGFLCIPSSIPRGENFGSFNEYFQFLRRRSRSILLPYLLWNFIYILFFLLGSYILPMMKSKVSELALDTPSGFFCALTGLWGRPADAPLWYLRNLFVYTLTLPVFLWFSRNLMRFILLLLGGILIFLCKIPIPSWLSMYLLPYAILSFGAGVFLRHSISLRERERERENIYLPAKYSTLTILLTISYLLLSFRVISWPPLVSIFQGFTGEYLFLIPLWLTIAKRMDFGPESYFHRFFVQPSFYLFASHGLFCSLALRILAPKIPESSFHAIILCSIYTLGGVIGIYLSYSFLLQFFPKTLSYLSGGRN